MKAWVLEERNKVTFKNIEKPICGDDQILVKNITSCICNGSEPAIIQGATWEKFPAVLGHEAYARIEEVGKNVTGYEVGEYITWWFSMGAFAEYAVVNPADVAVLKLSVEEVNEQEAPILELAIAAYRALYPLEIKDKRILIIGAGPSGLVMTQICKILGAKTITAWDLYDMRRKLAKDLGCVDECEEYDIVIDAFGNDITESKSTVNDGMSKLVIGGTLMLYGHPIEGRMLNSHFIQSHQIQVRTPVNDIEVIRKLTADLKKWYMSGELNLKCLITDVISLEEVGDALVELEKRPEQHIKIIVNI